MNSGSDENEGGRLWCHPQMTGEAGQGIYKQCSVLPEGIGMQAPRRIVRSLQRESMSLGSWRIRYFSFEAKSIHDFVRPCDFKYEFAWSLCIDHSSRFRAQPK